MTVSLKEYDSELPFRHMLMTKISVFSVKRICNCLNVIMNEKNLYKVRVDFYSD